VLLIRPAISDDATLLNTLIHEFAEFEHLEARISTETLLSDGFGPPPKFRALIAEWDRHPAAYAIFFDYYSSFRGAGLFLEDLYVFNVFGWNGPALDFYKKIGASFWNDWKVLCLEGPSLKALAEQASRPPCN